MAFLQNLAFNSQANNSIFVMDPKTCIYIKISSFFISCNHNTFSTLYLEKQKSIQICIIFNIWTLLHGTLKCCGLHFRNFCTTVHVSHPQTQCMPDQWNDKSSWRCGTPDSNLVKTSETTEAKSQDLLKLNMNTTKRLSQDTRIKCINS
jgi:hypothetical protein